ncbi:MAG TPA: hypothetical protein VMH33_08600 [Solirubrobacterales bacterium]|nr:hypothetical protein [Solirubrobacterales bacterium]
MAVAAALALVVAGTATAAAAAIEYRPSDFTAAIGLTSGGKTRTGTEFRDFTNKRKRRSIEYGEGETVSNFTFYDKQKAYSYDSLFNSCEEEAIPAGVTMSADVTDEAGQAVTNFVQEGTLEAGGEVLERWVGSTAEGTIVVGVGRPPGQPASEPTAVVALEHAGETLRYEAPFTSGQPDASAFNLPARCAGAGGPSAVIDTPAREALYLPGQVVGADFSCEAEEGGTIDPVEGCLGTVDEGEPIDTSTPGVHSFTVSAHQTNGENWTATRQYKVIGPPTVTISSPVAGAVYQQAQEVAARYECDEGFAGPYLIRCGEVTPPAMGVDVFGGPIDTSTAGPHTFTVIAESADGLTAQESIAYTVVAAPAGTAPASGSVDGAPSGSTVPRAIGKVTILHKPGHHRGRGHRGGGYSFRFSGEPGVSFVCSLDGSPFQPCTSPKVYRHLKRDKHVFRVKAIGADGAASPVTKIAFTAGRRQTGASRASG